ncbi:MAG: hypothetical protein JXR42_00440 [Gammaproteobacteria bacterium]|nr:hypothetical protein [Gammaproteobacteria bacterium]
MAYTSEHAIGGRRTTFIPESNHDDIFRAGIEVKGFFSALAYLFSFQWLLFIAPQKDYSKSEGFITVDIDQLLGDSKKGEESYLNINTRLATEDISAPKQFIKKAKAKFEKRMRRAETIPTQFQNIYREIVEVGMMLVQPTLNIDEIESKVTELTTALKKYIKITSTSAATQPTETSDPWPYRKKAIESLLQLTKKDTISSENIEKCTNDALTALHSFIGIVRTQLEKADQEPAHTGHLYTPTPAHTKPREETLDGFEDVDIDSLLNSTDRKPTDDYGKGNDDFVEVDVNSLLTGNV